MTRNGWLSAALVPALVLALACGGGSSDPLEAEIEELEIGGRLTMGGGGRNEVIAGYEDGKRASEYLHPVLVQIFNRTKDFAPQYSHEQQPVRMFGLFSGQAMVEDSFAVVNGIERHTLKAVFFDYSDDGRVFFGGRLRLYGPVTARFGPRDVQLNEKIAFAGDWAGTAEFENYQIPVDEHGLAFTVFEEDSIPRLVFHHGRIIYESEGSRVVLNPYPMPKPEP